MSYVNSARLTTATLAFALAHRQDGDTFEGTVVEKCRQRDLQAFGNLAQHFDGGSAAPGFDLRQHRPAYSTLPRQRVGRQMTLASQALKV
jgi:hypothetical protein